MSTPDQEFASITTYPSPELVSLEYQFEVHAGRVFDSGYIDTSRTFIVKAPTPEHIPPDLINVNPETTPLAWVEFYQAAFLNVKHPERFEGDMPGPKHWAQPDPEPDESIRGELFLAAPHQLVTNVTEYGLSLATVKEVVATGEVTPFMLSWLERFSVRTNDRGSHRFLTPLLSVLPHDLANTIADHKF